MAVLKKAAIFLSKTASTRFARTVFFRIELTQILSAYLYANHKSLIILLLGELMIAANI